MFGGVFGHAVEADELVLHARHAFAGAAGADHQPAELGGLVGEPGLLHRIGTEDQMRGVVEIARAVFEHVRHAVDQRLKQPHEDVRRVDLVALFQLLMTLWNADEFRRAHGQKNFLGENEAGRHQHPRLVVGRVEQRRGHIERVVLVAQPACGLDLHKLLLGRHAQPEGLLERRALGFGRVEQIDPGRGFQRRVLRATGRIGAEHDGRSDRCAGYACTWSRGCGVPCFGSLRKGRGF